MVYDEILQFFGQLNFALTNVQGANYKILANQVNGDTIFCIPMRNAAGSYIPQSFIENVAYNSLKNYDRNNVLFILVTDDVERDKHFATLAGINLWIIDENSRQLLIFENQPEDFYAIRYGIDQTLTQTYQAKAAKIRNKKNIPYVTIALIAVNVIWFVILMIKGNPESASFMASAGASYGPYVFEEHEYWRIFTSMFMHFGASHLLGNMLYLGIAGTNLEPILGRVKFALLYMLTGIGAGLISTAFYYMRGENVVSAGASGAIYGLIGAIVVLTYKTRGSISKRNMWLRIGIVLIFLFYSNFINTTVDAVAHIAGFALGIILALSFLATKNSNKKKETRS